jgi:hypothetical protein
MHVEVMCFVVVFAEVQKKCYTTEIISLLDVVCLEINTLGLIYTDSEKKNSVLQVSDAIHLATPSLSCVMDITPSFFLFYPFRLKCLVHRR